MGTGEGFGAQVRAAVVASREQADADAARRQAARVRLTKLVEEIEATFGQAVAHAGNALRADREAGAGERRTVTLLWREAPARELAVAVDPQGPRVTWQWVRIEQGTPPIIVRGVLTAADAPAGEPGEIRTPGHAHAVPIGDVDAFDVRPLILKLIDAGPWLKGRFPE